MATPSPGRGPSLATWILVGLIAGASLAAGLQLGLAPAPGTDPGDGWLAVLWTANNVAAPAGQVFLRMLFFVVIPLVFASLAAGVLQLGQLDRLGPLAGRTFTR